MKDIIGLNERKSIIAGKDLHYKKIAGIVLSLKQGELDSIRAEILNKLERALAIANNDMEHREGIDKLGTEGLRSYKRSLEQLLTKIVMGNERVRARLSSQYSGHSIGSREEPMFRPAGPVHVEKAAENNQAKYTDLDGMVGGELITFSMDSEKAVPCLAEFELDMSPVIQSNERVDQNQLRPENPNGPCLFRSLLAAAEEKAGRNLTLNQIIDSALTLKASNAIGDADEYYFVNDPTAVTKEGLKTLGYPDAIVTVGNTSSSPSRNGDFTIRYIASKGHFQLGDSKGNLLWEPYTYKIPSNAFTGKASSFRDVTINLQGKQHES
jgi:hypothetical protein